MPLRPYIPTQCVDVEFTAGAAFAAQKVVYLDPITQQAWPTNSKVPGQSTQGQMLGVAITPGTAGNPVRVRTFGIVSGLSGLTAGNILYFDNTGTITATASSFPQIIGIALDATHMYIQDVPLQRGATIAGYVYGGTTTTTAYPSQLCDKLTYATEAISYPASMLALSQLYYPGGCSNVYTSGYIAGGLSVNPGGAGAYSKDIQKVFYANEIVTLQTTATLTQARNYIGGISNGLTAGYMAGAWTGAVVKTTDKITYSTDVCANNTASNLITARNNRGLSNSGTAGYWGGGDSTGSSAWTSETDKIVYSTNITSNVTSAALSFGRGMYGCTQNGALYGYFLGGYTGTSFLKQCDRLNFSTNQTASYTTANLTVGTDLMMFVTNVSTAGYMLGGFTASSTLTTGILKLSYPSEAESSIGAVLKTARAYGAGISSNSV